MGLFYFFGCTLGTGTVAALWAMHLTGSDAYDYYICFAKAQRAFVLGCATGAAVASLFPAMIAEPLVAMLLFSCAWLLVTNNKK